MDDESREDIGRIWEALSGKMARVLSTRCDEVRGIPNEVTFRKEQLLEALMQSNDAVNAYLLIASQATNHAPKDAPEDLAPDFFDVENLPQLPAKEEMARATRGADAQRQKLRIGRGDEDAVESVPQSELNNDDEANEDASEAVPRSKPVPGGIVMLRRQLENNERSNRRLNAALQPSADERARNNNRGSHNGQPDDPQHDVAYPTDRHCAANLSCRPCSRAPPSSEYSSAQRPDSEYEGFRGAPRGDFSRGGQGGGGFAPRINFGSTPRNFAPAGLNQGQRRVLNPFSESTEIDQCNRLRNPNEFSKPPGYSGYENEQQETSSQRARQVPDPYAGNYSRLVTSSKSEESRSFTAAGRSEANFVRNSQHFDGGFRDDGWNGVAPRDARASVDSYSANNEAVEQEGGFARRSAYREPFQIKNEEEGGFAHAPTGESEGGFARRESQLRSRTFSDGPPRRGDFDANFAVNCRYRTHQSDPPRHIAAGDAQPDVAKELTGRQAPLDPYQALDDEEESWSEDDDECEPSGGRTAQQVAAPSSVVSTKRYVTVKIDDVEVQYEVACASAMREHSAPPSDQLVDVVITSIISQRDFAVMMARERDKYENLVIEMSNCDVYDEIFGMKVEEGEPCAVCIHNGIYRGRMETSNEKDCRVYLIDYGNYVHLLPKYIAPLLATHGRLPFASILCGLYAAFRCQLSVKLIKPFKEAFPVESQCKLWFVRASNHVAGGYEVDLYGLNGSHHDAFLPADAYSQLQRLTQRP